MNKPFRAAYLLFAAAALADLWFVNQGGSERYFTKPLLMPLLMLGYYLEARPTQVFSRLILLALFFSWLGDVFLMLENRNAVFFIVGLVCFLTAHLLYIYYFASIKPNTRSFMRKRPVMLLAVLAYVVELLYVLWPHLGGMKVPVLIYGIVIGTMLAFALWQYGKIPAQAAWLFITGALLFVASDSLLAINKFKTPIAHGGLWIMGTYILAQYFIARGSIKHLKNQGDEDPSPPLPADLRNQA
jgi:uncharacterized membrane protein YhhN